MDEKTTIIRISGKLGTKINDSPEQEMPMHQNPYLDWSAHLFRADRVQYILITNTASLYSSVIYGRGITDSNEFLKGGIRSLEDILEEDGFQLIFKRIIVPALGSHHFCKALNRAVIGSMNELVKKAQNCLTVRELSPYRTALRLNETRFSYIDYQEPIDAFQNLKAGENQTEQV